MVTAHEQSARGRRLSGARAANWAKQRHEAAGYQMRDHASLTVNRFDAIRNVLDLAFRPSVAPHLRLLIDSARVQPPAICPGTSPRA